MNIALETYISWRAVTVCNGQTYLKYAAFPGFIGLLLESVCHRGGLVQRHPSR